MEGVQGELRQALTEQEYVDAERSVANAHYTGDWHIDAIWKALQNMGAGAGGALWPGGTRRAPVAARAGGVD